MSIPSPPLIIDLRRDLLVSMQPHPCYPSRGSRRRRRRSQASVLKLFEKVRPVVPADCRRLRWRAGVTRCVIFVILVGRRGNVHLGHDPGLHHAHRRSPPHGRGRPLGILGALRKASESHSTSVDFICLTFIYLQRKLLCGCVKIVAAIS